MLGIVALGGVQCICPVSPTTSTAPYLINQREGGEARAYCSLLSPGFSVKRLRAYGRKINHQIYCTAKSLPNLTTFSTSNYPENTIR